MQQGLIHLYWGEGKGKTTAAMGLALRALGNGKRVVIVQFLKGGDSGEIPLLRRLGATVYRGKAGQKFVHQMDGAGKLQARAMQAESRRQAWRGAADLLILDEACGACQLDMVEESLLRQAVLEKPAEQELVLTGREPADWMREAADYSTEMRCHRHPFNQGIGARKGVEYLWKNTSSHRILSAPAWQLSAGNWKREELHCRRRTPL